MREGEGNTGTHGMGSTTEEIADDQRFPTGLVL